MSLGQHLVELRKRLMIAAIALVVGMVVAFFITDFVIWLITEPIRYIAVERGDEIDVAVLIDIVRSRDLIGAERRDLKTIRERPCAVVDRDFKKALDIVDEDIGASASPTADAVQIAVSIDVSQLRRGASGRDRLEEKVGRSHAA